MRRRGEIHGHRIFNEVIAVVNGKSKLKYRGAEVIAAADACDAGRSLKDLRLLSAEVPLLPLKTL